ncbi:MAG: DUF1844 domain-containing protein [Candidatus Omnitrophica bacterium CG07_land_8_20_14_0_80_42_15]|uniref:DUF1844 domain-containing protein n=1 Tax=Candidatus Aquitaenariimonas noxiae TaxID=1974741 RepID=A0A2J0KZM7_9BACT|nr:MAG: DUF1844 domain-containing protein [Candidatus Omnitrophica bacterium CG07_land_8_20_14_0_80_42_15]
MSDENVNHIDEGWKEAVKKEKEKTDQSGEQVAMPPKPDFNFFISSLAIEALMAMGEMENPFTKERSINLKQAQYLIDAIDMLREKSKGNLTAEETTLINDILADLKMRYVNKAKL